MSKKDKILSYYDKFKSGEMSLIEVAVCSKTNQSYVGKVHRIHEINLNYQNKPEQVIIDGKSFDESLDAPKFWNPEDEIKTPPCVGHIN